MPILNVVRTHINTSFFVTHFPISSSSKGMILAGNVCLVWFYLNLDIFLHTYKKLVQSNYWDQGTTWYTLLKTKQDNWNDYNYICEMFMIYDNMCQNKDFLQKKRRTLIPLYKDSDKIVCSNHARVIYIGVGRYISAKSTYVWIN